MTEVTGALLSRQVRREKKGKKSKNVVLTVKPEYLKDLCLQQGIAPPIKKAPEKSLCRSSFLESGGGIG